MKLLAIVGTNADFSYNRFLDQFMAKRYKDQAEIEVYEIADLPRFKKEAQPDSKVEEFKIDEEVNDKSNDFLILNDEKVY